MLARDSYNTATFNAAEYVAMYPDLQDWWNGVIPGSEGVKAEWKNDRNAWALDHWTTHGEEEGREGRSTVFTPADDTPEIKTLGGPAAKAQDKTWLWLALGAGVALYFYYRNQQDKS